ncbi:MAG: hypothetical protein QJR09_10680 [Micrococcus sp.]|nr:hypothetical protein [Micrococcus sp.]
MAARELVQQLPQNVRRWVYVIFALVGVALGATVNGFGTAEIAQPLWLEIAGSTYLYLGGAFGLTAALNVGAKKAAEVPVAPVSEPDATPVPDDYQPQHRAKE